MFWSPPNPWASSTTGPSGFPVTVTLFLCSTRMPAILPARGIFAQPRARLAWAGAGGVPEHSRPGEPAAAADQERGAHVRVPARLRRPPGPGGRRLAAVERCVALARVPE